jgi:hypothetical protein
MADKEPAKEYANAVERGKLIMEGIKKGRADLAREIVSKYRLTYMNRADLTELNKMLFQEIDKGKK